jgi:flagellar biosynthetic protein FliP
VSFGAYAGVALALGLVLVLLGVSLKLLQRLAPGTTRGRVRIPMEVVQRLALGPKQGIAVVRIGERVVALSVGEGGVRRLYELTEEEAGAIISATPPAAPPGTGVDFRAAFKGALRTAGIGAALVFMITGSASAQAPTAGNAAQALANAAAAAPRTLQRPTTPANNSLQRPTAPAAGGLTPSTALSLVRQATGAATGTAPGANGNARPAGTVAAASQAAAKAPAAAVQAPMVAPVATAGADIAVTKLAPQLDLRVGGQQSNGGLRLSGTVGIVVMMGLLTLLPTLLLMMTSFTRILIVLHFLRQALGTQNAPPAQLVAAMAILLTGFVMAPTLTMVNRDALQPWMNGQIEQGEMLDRGVQPFKAFMLRQTRQHDLQVFVDLSRGPKPATAAEVPLITLMSAFVTSELRTAFQIGFALFLPFIIIDVVVSSVLMSMGMMMLPPAMISLPFKLLLFVLVDGWTLIVQSLVASFR